MWVARSEKLTLHVSEEVVSDQAQYCIIYMFQACLPPPSISMRLQRKLQNKYFKGDHGVRFKQTKTSTTRMSLFITLWVSLTKVSDHYCHHEELWLAAMTPHWLHQLSTIAIDKYIMAYLWFHSKSSQKSASRVSMTLLETSSRLSHALSYQSRNILPSLQCR